RVQGQEDDLGRQEGPLEIAVRQEKTSLGDAELTCPNAAWQSASPRWQAAKATSPIQLACCRPNLVRPRRRAAGTSALAGAACRMKRRPEDFVGGSVVKSQMRTSLASHIKEWYIITLAWA